MPFFRHAHGYGDDPASEREIAGIAAQTTGERYCASGICSVSPYAHPRTASCPPVSETTIAEIVAAEAQAAGEHEAGRDQRRRDDVTDEQIVSLRARGMSWSAIAAQTGMSRSGARQRWLSASGEPRARDR